jgi:hypothetical protein
MFQQQHLVIRRCLVCERRVIVPPSCKGQHYAQRPLHTPSVLSIIYPDGRPEALIAANIHRQDKPHTPSGTHVAHAGAGFVGRRLPLHGPQYITQHIHISFLWIASDGCTSYLNARQPLRHLHRTGIPWLAAHYVHSTGALRKEPLFATSRYSLLSLVQRKEMEQARCRKQPSTQRICKTRNLSHRLAQVVRRRTTSHPVSTCRQYREDAAISPLLLSCAFA